MQLQAMEALTGPQEEQSPMLMITYVLCTLVPQVETTETLIVEEEEERSSSTPRNNFNEGDGNDSEEQVEAPLEEQIEHQNSHTK